jgi:hypothetical protein
MHMRCIFYSATAITSVLWRASGRVTAQGQTHDKVKDLTKSSVQDLRIISDLSPSGCSSIGNAGIEPVLL